MQSLTQLWRSPKSGLLSTVINKCLTKYLPQIQSVKGMAAAPTSTGAQPIGKRRFRLPVEEDPHKLVNYCCGANYEKDGEPIKLKPDEEYPDWVWKLRLNLPARLTDLDPNTKEYWERLDVVGRQQMWRRRKLERRRFKIVNDRLQTLEELRWRRRFRALAYKHFDAGYEIVEHTEREDLWNVEKKERFREPEEKEPFYPGIDKVDLPYEVTANRLSLRHTKRIGRFGW